MKDLLKPYYLIWFDTRNTIQKVNSKELPFNLYITIIISLLSAGIPILDSYELNVINVVFLFIAFSILMLLMAHIYPWLLRVIGKIWSGKASKKGMQNVVSLSLVPITLVFILQLARLPFGDFSAAAEISYVIQIIAYLFQVRILVIGLSEVQGFSYGFAIMNLVIAYFPAFLYALF